ncbi:MAG: RidA family protein [Clostridia bacterium]|nr:RidA family protein [Clostridia bacterium]MBN2883271.1 RidA family protein [Clostridia bacterium]
MKRIISTDKAPGAIGPYSQAVECNGIVYTSGMIAIDPATGSLSEGGINEQTNLVLCNLEALFRSIGMNLGNVVKTTVFMKNMSQFAEMNAIYAKYFKENPPARSTVEVARLPKDVLVEIECIAARE